jgi:hypothetical protein
MAGSAVVSACHATSAWVETAVIDPKLMNLKKTANASKPDWLESRARFRINNNQTSARY